MDNNPKVKAFHVFKAIKAKAKGTRTAVLNLSPSKNGSITFLITLEDLPENQPWLFNALLKYKLKYLLLLMVL